MLDRYERVMRWLAWFAVVVGVVILTLHEYWHVRLYNPPYQGTPDLVLPYVSRELRASEGQRFIDPGCGEGTVPLYLASTTSAYVDCADFDAAFVAAASVAVDGAGLSSLVSVHHADALKVDYSPYDGVYLFMSAVFNERILPRLLNQMRPGTRIVSLSHSSKTFPPTYTRAIKGEGRDWLLHVWVVPERVTLLSQASMRQ